MLRKSRKYLVLLLALLALGFFLYKFRNSIALEGFRWSMVGQSLRHARLGLLFLSLLTFYGCYAVRSLRWMRFCRWLGATRFGNVLSSTLMGFSCIFLLGRAGEPIRPVLIARKDSLSIPGMFGVYVLERVFDMTATALIAGLALLSFERRGAAGQGSDVPMTIARSAGVLLLAALVAAIAFLIYFRYHGAAWLARKLQHESWRKGWREKVAVLLEGFSDGLRGIRTAGDLGVLALYTAAHWTLVGLAYVWAIHAFPGPLAALSLGGVLLVLAFGLIGSAVQLPAVGGGAQAATFIVLTLILGVEKVPAAVVSIVLWLLGFAGCCIVGVPLLFREGWSMGDLRRMARASEVAGEAALLAEAEQGAASPPVATAPKAQHSATGGKEQLP
jgi:glycosyltransferase 2 family protein